MFPYKHCPIRSYNLLSLTKEHSEFGPFQYMLASSYSFFEVLSFFFPYGTHMTLAGSCSDLTQVISLLAKR